MDEILDQMCFDPIATNFYRVLSISIITIIPRNVITFQGYQATFKTVTHHVSEMIGLP